MEPSKRLFSLDVLRGFCMLLLLYGSAVAWAMVGAPGHADTPVPWWPRWITTQFSHPWGVYTLFDIVQPLFAVVCGASVPLALDKRLENGCARGVYWRHVLGRFLLLFVTGAVLFGFLTLDVARAPYFGNTLQLLACGYLFTAVCRAWVPRRFWPAVAALLVLAWGLVLGFGGDFSKNGNVAAAIERYMTALLVPGKTLKEVETTYWATVPMFCALTLAGAYAMGFLRDTSRSLVRRANTILAVGAALTVAGLALHPVQPIIKHIYSASYTVFSCGLDFLLWGAFIWIYDIWSVRRGTWLLSLYGRASLASYVQWCLFGTFYLAASWHHLGPLATRFLPVEYHEIVKMCGALVLSTGVLWLWSRRRGGTA